ncbi:MAG: hypothetical protein LBE91_00410 [Tannerella sp.]|nr:hypothetical protein [Tannerella sp.]
MTAALFAASAVCAQVGINTETPKASLHVKEILPVTIAEGIIAPNVSIANLNTAVALYGADQTGAIVYVNDVTGGSTNAQTANITATGYYYFDGTAWQAMKGSTGGGSGWLLTGNANATSASYLGTPTGTDVDLYFKRNGEQAGWLDGVTFNTSFGVGSLPNENNNGWNTAIGYKNLADPNYSGKSNTAVGAGNMTAGPGGHDNVAIGFENFGSNNEGHDNVAIGTRNLTDNYRGHDNIAIGSAVLDGISDGIQNIAIGSRTLQDTDGSNNIAIGFHSGEFADGNDMIIIGSNLKASQGDSTLNIGDVIFGVSMYNVGKIGIGTPSPRTTLEINGSATNESAYNAGTVTTIDFTKSNLARTTSTATTGFTLNGMKDGGTYTLAIQANTTAAITGFTAPILGSSPAANFTLYYADSTGTDPGRRVYTIVCIGTEAYIYVTLLKAL